MNVLRLIISAKCLLTLHFFRNWCLVSKSGYSTVQYKAWKICREVAVIGLQ